MRGPTHARVGRRAYIALGTSIGHAAAMIASRMLPLRAETASSIVEPPPESSASPASSSLDSQDAEVDAGGEDDWQEVTVPHLDVSRVLSELLALVSRTESLASAAERAHDVVGTGSTAGSARRSRRVADLLVATRESALRALEVGDHLAVELSRSRGM